MYAVILAGGSGTRLRPIGGTENPVAFHRMPDGRTLLQHTGARLEPLVDPMDVVVVANRRHGQLVREQLPEARLVTQPMNRGTLTAVALALVSVERPELETMVVTTADMEVDDPAHLRDALAVADSHVVGGAVGIERPLVTLAVRPTAAERELTYIEPSIDAAARIGGQRVYRVASVEPKPTQTRARQLFESGTTFWAAGVYAGQRGVFAAALDRYTPVFTLLRPAFRSELALRAAYDRLQPVSLEEGMLAGAARDGSVVAMPVEAGWRNIG